MLNVESEKSNYLELHRDKTINLDISNKCTLACSGCAREEVRLGQYEMPKSKDMTLAEFEKISEHFRGKRIHFRGTFSDPVFNTDFLDMLGMCKEKNILPVIHNAASHMPESWYEEAFLRNPRSEWWFGIDGLPEQSHIYRKKQDGEKLYRMMLKAKKMGVETVVWQYIIFGYNEDNVEAARQMAKDHKLAFLLIKSYRGGVKEISKTSSFKPKCLRGREFGHSITGHITPCCWTNTRWNVPKFKALFSDELRVKSMNRVEDILTSKPWTKFFDTLINNPDQAADICKLRCTIPEDVDPENTEQYFDFDHQS